MIFKIALAFKSLIYLESILVSGQEARIQLQPFPYDNHLFPAPFIGEPTPLSWRPDMPLLFYQHCIQRTICSHILNKSVLKLSIHVQSQLL